MLRLSWRAWLHDGAPRVGPWWIGLAWTLVFGLGVAAVLSVVTLALSSAATRAIWPTVVAANVIISVTISFAVRLAFWLARRAVGAGRLAAWSPARRSIYFTLVPITGVAIGWPLGMMLAGLGSTSASWRRSMRPGVLGSSIVVALLRHRPVPAVLPHQGAPDRRPRTAATEAQLRLLQAQIEPHFLFNTLANVVSLMDADPPRAKAMLESFVDYLRASLAGLGHGTHTLGDEIDLIDAYLRIIKMRMEDRLRLRRSRCRRALRGRPCRR